MWTLSTLRIILRRGCCSCLHRQFLFSLYKASKWCETLATLKSMNCLFLEWPEFSLGSWRITKSLTSFLNSEKKHILVTLNQVALLSFWESSPTHKPSLSSNDHLGTLVHKEIYPRLQHTRVFNFFISASVSLLGFALVLALTDFFGWVSQDELAEQFCIARLVPQMKNPADN